MQIEDKVVLITGASEGIGAACASVFRQRGARLCVTARSEAKLKAAASADDLVAPGDLLDPGVPERVVAAAMERFGRIDVLINNAGAGLYTPAHSVSPDLARRLFDLNLFAPLEMIRQTVPYMKRQRSGVIVNVSSIAGMISLPWFTLYSASKAALISMTDGIRIELRQFGIHCIAVLPGYVRTDFQRNILAGEVPPALGPMRQRWAITPAQCAEAIARGVERDARTVVTPRITGLLAAVGRLLPGLMDRQLESIWLREAAEARGRRK